MALKRNLGESPGLQKSAEDANLLEAVPHLSIWQILTVGHGIDWQLQCNT